MIAPLRIRDTLQARREVPFYNQIDLLAIEDDILIGATGNLTLGFVLEGINLMFKSKQEIISVVEFLRQALGHLPEKTQFQFILKHRPGPGRALFDYRRSIRTADAFSTALIESKETTLRKDALFNSELYLFITKFYDEKHKLTSGLDVFRKKTIEANKEAFLARKQELLSAKTYLENAFGNLKVKMTPLKEKEYKSFFYFHLNPARASKSPLVNSEENPAQNITLRASLLFSPPVVEREHIYQDGYFFQGINLLLPPEHTEIQGLGKMLERISVPYDLMLSIYVPDNELEIEALKTRANVSKTFSFFGGSKNYDSAQKYHDIDSLITEIKSSSQKLAYYSLSFLVRDRNFYFLKRKQDQIVDAFPALGSAEGIADHMNHDRLFLSFLPGQAWMNPRRYLIQSDALVNLLPIQSDWRGTEKAGFLLKSRKQELLKLDLFENSLPAKHGVIMGATGSGKSFATNYLLMNYLLENRYNQLVIIDVGNSYRRLASFFKGAYFDIDLGENYAINPLLPKNAVISNGEINNDSLAYLGLITEKLVKGHSDEILTNAHKRLIEKALLKVYETKNAPLLTDLLQVLKTHSFEDASEKQKALEFAKNLSIWAEGRYGKLLNRHGNLGTDNRFVVFELGKLDAYPDLQSLIFFIIRSAIASKLYQKANKKVIVIDEGWRFFNDETSARLIEDLYRTARKFNGLVLSISQSPEDFLNTKAANAIISNSFTKYILKLNKGHELLSRFELSDTEIEAVKSLVSRPGMFSEAFIKYGTDSTIGRIEPTALEYWIATTDPGDYALEQEVRKRNPTFDAFALLKYLAENSPKGATAHASAR